MGMIRDVGPDTVQAIERRLAVVRHAGMPGRITYVSTAGGAFLEWPLLAARVGRLPEGGEAVAPEGG